MSRPDRRPLVRAACSATLLLVLLLGITPLWLWAVATVPTQLAPAEIGTPLLLPPLRLVPLGGEGWGVLACEDFAAVVLVLTVRVMMRRHLRVWRRSSRRHRLAAGWGALIVAGAVAGVFRGLVESRLTMSGPLGWAGYPFLGAAAGACWGAALGWVPGLATALARPRYPLELHVPRQGRGAETCAAPPRGRDQPTAEGGPIPSAARTSPSGVYSRPRGGAAH